MEEGMVGFFLSLVMIVTAYCNDSCDKPTYHPTYGVTASGTKTHQGTIACPPEWAFGTKVYIPGVGRFVCEDRGSAIKGNRIDIWFRTCEEALKWGRQRREVFIFDKNLLRESLSK